MFDLCNSLQNIVYYSNRIFQYDFGSLFTIQYLKQFLFTYFNFFQSPYIVHTRFAKSNNIRRIILLNIRPIRVEPLLRLTTHFSCLQDVYKTCLEGASSCIKDTDCVPFFLNLRITSPLRYVCVIVPGNLVIYYYDFRKHIDLWFYV